jgi:hypothetical protein
VDAHALDSEAAARLWAYSAELTGAASLSALFHGIFFALIGVPYWRQGAKAG